MLWYGFGNTAQAMFLPRDHSVGMMHTANVEQWALLLHVHEPQASFPLNVPSDTQVGHHFSESRTEPPRQVL